MIKKNQLIHFLLFFFSTSLLWGSSIFVPQSGVNLSKEFSEKKGKEKSPYLSGSATDQEKALHGGGKTPFLSGESVPLTSEGEKERSLRSAFVTGDDKKKERSAEEREITDKELYAGPNGHVAGKDYTQEGEMRLEAKHSAIANLGRSSYSLLFYKDNFSYGDHDKNSVFYKTYREKRSGHKAQTPFMASLFCSRFAWFGIGLWGLGVDLGVGFNQGKASFHDGTISDALITLWDIPIGLMASYELPIGPWFHIGVKGGPAYLTLIQNRSDRDTGEKGKNYYAGSFGYQAELLLKLSFLSFSRDLRGHFLRQYNSTNAYFVFSARYEDFGHFKQKDIHLKGTSFGGGFAFDFL